jgi:hypothetical protein
MIPHLHIHEQLLFEHCQDLFRERQQQRLEARLRHHHFSYGRGIAGRLGAFFIVLGMRLKRLEPGSEAVGV